MSRQRIPKRVRLLTASAVAYGWKLDFTSSGHWRLKPPDGWRAPEGVEVHQVTFSATPSDIRGDKNALATLRRMGVR